MASAILSTACTPSHLIITVASQFTNEQIRVREYVRLGPSRKKMATEWFFGESLIQGLFIEVREGLKKPTRDSGEPQGQQQWRAVTSYRSEGEGVVTSTQWHWGCRERVGGEELIASSLAIAGSSHWLLNPQETRGKVSQVMQSTQVSLLGHTKGRER